MITYIRVRCRIVELFKVWTCNWTAWVQIPPVHWLTSCKILRNNFISSYSVTLSVNWEITIVSNSWGCCENLMDYSLKWTCMKWVPSTAASVVTTAPTVIGMQKSIKKPNKVHPVILFTSDTEVYTYILCCRIPQQFHLDILFSIFSSLKSPVESQLNRVWVLDKIRTWAEAFNHRQPQVSIHSLPVFQSTQLNVFSLLPRPLKVTWTWQASLNIKQF